MAREPLRRRTVGYLIIGIAALIGAIIYAFNRALTDIVNATCDHGASCSMWASIRFQTTVSLAIMTAILLIGLYFVVFGERQQQKREAEEARKFSTERYEALKKTLSKAEDDLMKRVVAADGTIFQSALGEQTGMTKVKVTRLLDKLEGRGLIERKRRGMTNVVIIKP